MGAVTLLRDIRERKKVEDEIREGKKELEELLATSVKLEIIERLKKDLDEKFWERLIEAKNNDTLLKDVNLNYSEEEILDIVIAKLSNREKEVMQLIMNGCNHSEVSSYLGISYNYPKVIYCRII